MQTFSFSFKSKTTKAPPPPFYWKSLTVFLGEENGARLVLVQVGHHVAQQQADEPLRLVLRHVEQHGRLLQQEARHVQRGAHLGAEVLQRQPLKRAKDQLNSLAHLGRWAVLVALFRAAAFHGASIGHTHTQLNWPEASPWQGDSPE